MEAIKIGIDFDTKGLKQGTQDIKQNTRDLKNEFRTLMSMAVGKNVSTQFNSMALSIEKTIQKADGIRKKMYDLEGTKIPSDEFARLTTELKYAEKEFNSLVARKEKLESKGGRIDPSFEQSLQRASDNVETLKTSMQSLLMSEKAYVPAETTSGYKDLSRQLAMTNSQLDIQTTKWYEVGEKEGAFNAKIPRTVKAIVSLNKSLAKGTVNATKFAISMGKIASQKIRDRFKKTPNDVDNISKSFKKGLKMILMYGFGIRGLFRLINKLRGYAKDALGLMSKQFEDVNRDMSILVSKFSQFKNSIGTMVQPIIHALVPALVTLMNVLSGAMTKIAEFFAVLTGQKYIYKATDANIDYAKSLDDATASTKKNTKAVKDNQKQLGYYDKLNVIGQDKDKDTTPDTGAGAGSGNGASGFIKAEPTKAVSEFAKKVKEAWKKADFTEVGNIIGKKLQNALEKIPWNGIKKTAKKVGKSLGTLINGFVETSTNGVTLGSTIGKTIAEGFNTVVLGLNTFLKTVKWESVSKFITDGLNTAIKTVDWTLLGNTIGEFFNAKMTLISGFWNDTDWKSLGTNLSKGFGEFVKTFDTGKLASMIFGKLSAVLKLLNGIFDGIDWDEAWKTGKQKLVDFLNGIDFKEIANEAGNLVGNIFNAIIQIGKNVIKDVQEYFKPFIKMAGGNVVQGFFYGMLYALGNLAIWIYNNIAKPFISGLGKAFGIKGSTSTIMKTIGINIMNGFKTGLLAVWRVIKDLIKGVILPVIKTAFNGLISFFKNLLSKIKNVFANIGSWFGNKFNSVVNAIKSAFSIKTIKGIFENVFKAIKTVFVGVDGKGGVIKLFKDAFSGAWTAIKNVFSKGGELFDGITEGVSSTFKSLIKSLIKGINSVIAVPFKKINKLLNKISGVKIDLPKPMKDITPFSFIGTDPLPVPKIEIPGLAQGAVIPPNREFLAMLGDQKQGVNIETPLDTMIQAFRTALNEQGGTSTSQGDIVVQINGREIARAVRDENSKQYKQTGAFMPRYS